MGPGEKLSRCPPPSERPWFYVSARNIDNLGAPVTVADNGTDSRILLPPNACFTRSCFVNHPRTSLTFFKYNVNASDVYILNEFERF
jgi:hypothetical protein